ncbi:MAG: hypothetical protein ACP5I8_15280 [Phycisphaerae bacterium]
MKLIQDMIDVAIENGQRLILPAGVVGVPGVEYPSAMNSGAFTITDVPEADALSILALGSFYLLWWKRSAA